MPIYEYRCSGCGHQEEFLQKLSDPQLTKCPACGKETFSKMLTAAGFQLKGSGWYVTDFRGGSGGKSAPAVKTDGKAGEGKSSESSSGESKGGESKSSESKAAAGESKAAPKSESKSEAKTESKAAPKPASSSGSGT